MKKKKEERITTFSPVKWSNLANDIKSGMTDDEILTKYKWKSLPQLQLYKSELVALGLLSSKDVLQSND